MADDFPDTSAIAQEATKDLLADLNIQEQTIAREHDLKTKLYIWDNIIVHLNTLVSEDSAIHGLLLDVIDKLLELRELIEGYEVTELKLIAEEKSIVREINSHISDKNSGLQHKGWQLVKIVESKAKGKAQKFYKLEIAELKKLKRKFTELGLLIEKSKTIKINPSDGKTAITEFKREEEYYFLQLYRFASIYANVLGGLLIKEELLLRRR